MFVRGFYFLNSFNVQEINRKAINPIKLATKKGVPKPMFELGTLFLKV